MSFSPKFPVVSTHRSTVLEENIMTATYTFDVFTSLDGFGAHSCVKVIRPHCDGVSWPQREILAWCAAGGGW